MDFLRCQTFAASPAEPGELPLLLRLRSGSAAWRLAFAFDPKRRAVVLCGASKSGTSQTRFYRSLIERADARFASYLARIGEN